jgi:hypothetical protein
MGHPEASQGDLETQQSCEVLTKIRGNLQPLKVKPKVRTNEMLCKSNAKVRGGRTTSVSIDSLVQKSRGTYNLCEHRQTSAKVTGNVQPL